MNELDTWIAAACGELGLHPDDIKATAVLDVARDVAHQVIRPGAPVSAYLMGVAVGRGADPSDVAARLSALALSWPQGKPDEKPTGANVKPHEKPTGANVKPHEKPTGANVKPDEKPTGANVKPDEKPTRATEMPDHTLTGAKESWKTS